MSPRVHRPLVACGYAGWYARAPAWAHVVLGLALLVGSAVADELDVGASRNAAAPTLPDVEPDMPPLPVSKLIAARPIMPSDLPPPSVFATRGLPRRVNPGVAVERQDRRDRSDYRAVVEREAAAYGVPAELADAVMAVESGYNPATVGADGEVGLMQVLPSTARMLGFAGTLEELAAPDNIIHYGVMYLAAAWRLGRQDICTATMKYRAGLGEVRFSVRSVEYCVRVRAHLTARGVLVTGTVPEPTFGQPFGVASRGHSVLGRGAGTVNLEALNARLRELTDRVAMRTLR